MPATQCSLPGSAQWWLSGIVGSTVISRAYVRNSVVGSYINIHSQAAVEESVILGETTLKEGARIRRAIIDHGNIIESGDRIGYDLKRDSSRFHVNESGIVVVPHR
ncbi:MAG: hypothetical protein ACLFVG_03580 [Candidatus Aminicenantes bacterium]